MGSAVRGGLAVPMVFALTWTPGPRRRALALVCTVGWTAVGKPV
ncbi:hypothetical protein OOK31_33820 [Streptomyces sp. NBC_00249]|nr:hypothetical protein [Streptomyces sp. NBC_00249]MCX5198807.1 hypothetical protein [Streptomyces sp. NBC_00249]